MMSKLGPEKRQLERGSTEDLFVVRLLQPVLANVNSIVTRVGQKFRDGHRQRVVDQESHCPLAGGSTRSRTASAA